jgi:hypothetical protein
MRSTYDAALRYSSAGSGPYDGLKAELLGFPNVRHDDQVDSVTQALSWIGQRRQNKVACVAPIIVSRPRTYFGDNPNCF